MTKNKAKSQDKVLLCFQAACAASTKPQSVHSTLLTTPLTPLRSLGL